MLFSTPFSQTRASQLSHLLVPTEANRMESIPAESVHTGQAEVNLRFPLVAKRWHSAFLWSVLAVNCVGLCFFLFAKISEAPAVRNQILVCIAFMLGIAMVSFYRVGVALCHELRVQSDGICIRRFLHERKIKWSQIESYSIRFHRDAPSMCCVSVRTHESDDWVEIPSGALSEIAHVRLRSALYSQLQS